MIFFVLMPGLFGGLGNYLIPIYVGSPEIIFPRLNNCSVLFTSLSLVIMILALLTEYSIGPGWTVYPPLSLYPVNTTVLVITGLVVNGLGTLVTSINYILTAFHTLILADLFVPAMVITSVMLVFVLPVLTGALLLIISDMYFNTIFWKGVINGNSGDPVLYQHLFWFEREPFNIERYYSHTAICLNSMLSFVMYYIVSLNLVNIIIIYSANLVTIMTMVENKQVTNNSPDKSNLVGTSETLRSVPLNISDDRFDQWLAGFIDGRGNFYVNKSGNCSFELVVDKYDELVLLFIKNKLGGSIKSRVRSNSYRYRLRYDTQLIDLLNRINGNIRSSQRIPQFRQICTHYSINYITPILLTNNNAWYSGYFDANGTINCDRLNIELTVSTKHEIDIKMFNTGPFSGGNYNYVKSGYGYYTWSTTDKSTILDIYNYFKLYPSRTHMLHRIKLIQEFYTLKSDSSLYNQTTLDKLWNTFLTKWEDRVKIKSSHIKFDELTNIDITNIKNDRSWNEWLAGFIDGDGYIRVSGGHCFLEIPQETSNVHVLSMIQSKLGGIITKRNTSNNTYRYYLGTREGMIQLTHRINGNIRGYKRQMQFKELCAFLNILYIVPETLSINNAWYSGFIDSDGTITATFQSPSIRIKATSKYLCEVELFVSVLGGKVYKQSTSYDWIVNDTNTILTICDYLSRYPLYSIKNSRVKLIPSFYNLRTSKAYKTNSLNYSEWKLLEIKWNSWKTL
jgi:hypothetical protein